MPTRLMEMTEEPKTENLQLFVRIAEPQRSISAEASTPEGPRVHFKLNTLTSKTSDEILGLSSHSLETGDGKDMTVSKTW